MTDLFKQRVAAFQMFLDFPGPYAASIRAFMRDVLYRLNNGTALTDGQAELLLTRDLTEIHSVLDEFAISIEQSAIRLRMLLVQGDTTNAYLHCRSWPNNYWRIYEQVLDMYVFEGSSYLKNPIESSTQAMNVLKSVFPTNLNAVDVLEGQDSHFQEQLLKNGNPWK